MKDDHNNLLSRLTLQRYKYNIKIRLLEYCGLLSALNHLWKSHKHNFIASDFAKSVFSCRRCQ